MPPTVLCVAEKPSLAASIAAFLSDGTHRTRRGSGPEVHEFTRRFRGAACDFRVTAVLGHVLTIDFPPRFQSWDVDPRALFAAPVTKLEASPGARVVEHLERESRGCSEPHPLARLRPRGREHMLRGDGRVRALHASDELARPPRQVQRGDQAERRGRHVASGRAEPMRSPGGGRQAGASTSRSALRSRGSRRRTSRGKHPALDASVLSYGPCQTPALGFAVERHDARLRHVPEPYWVVEAEVEVEENRKPDLSAAEPVEEAPESKESFAPEESESESFAPTESSRGKKEATRSRATRSLTWTRGRVFDERVAAIVPLLRRERRDARTTRVDVETRTRAPPAGLNTVDMLKAASAGMGMGGGHRACRRRSGCTSRGSSRTPGLSPPRTRPGST